MSTSSPKEIPLGAIRLNSDSQKLEYWNGSAWFQIRTLPPAVTGARACVMTGYGPADVNTIDYFNMATGGNAVDFGDMLTVGAYRNCTSDSHGGLE